MPLHPGYQKDYEILLALQNHNGGRMWTTPDNRIGKGSPFSARDCGIMLAELGITIDDPLGAELGETLLANWRDDGKIRVAPKGTIYPCHTITIARTLSHLGFQGDTRVRRTYDHLMEIQDDDGGWKCNKYSGGRGPETNHSNPGPSLEALDALRFSPYFENGDERLERAAGFLLGHWEIKYPIGPCHFGIGTMFKRLEYPFLRYNLFYYCYVLSHFAIAGTDARFREAMALLQSKLVDDKVVVEYTNRKLRDLEFCKVGESSELATRRMHEIAENLGV